MRRFACLLLLVGVWLLATPLGTLAQADSSSAVEVVFLNVGQGDAAFIRSPEGKVALIDAGERAGLVEVLRAHGIDTIDIAIASHPHTDHIGAMADVIQAMPVRYYMDNAVPHTSATYLHLMQVLRDSDITYLQPVSRTIALGSVSLKILPPPTRAILNLNDRSVGVIVEHGTFRALLTGDSERAELLHFLQLGVPDVTVMKVPHHGSDDAVLPSFIQTTSPELAVISCGRWNQSGHPSPLTLRAYREAGVATLRTDVDGEVRVWGAEDGRFSIWTEREGMVYEGVASNEPMPEQEQADPRLGIQASSDILSLWVIPDAPGDDHENLNGEYSVISNHGTEPLQIGGWTLCDAAQHCFTFPQDSRIPGGQRVTLFTGYGRSDGVRFYMGSGSPVWSNEGDVATLYDSQRQVVVTYVY